MTRSLLRHTVATLAYRAEKALRDMPETAATMRPAPSSRTPTEILSHMGDLMNWAVGLAQGEYVWAPEPVAEWEPARQRFFDGVARLDAALAEPPVANRHPDETIFQGPIADALTHVGQIALLRGMAGAAVRPESYARAEISIGRVGIDQSDTRREFDGDASVR